jgi:BMFP domain-containing protein YqiC
MPHSNFAVPYRFVAGIFNRAAVSSGMTNDSIESLARKLADSVPEGLRSMRNDLEENFRSVLKSGFSKLDLVTREEFEVQEAVLKRTREKLEALEARVTEYEKNQ